MNDPFSLSVSVVIPTLHRSEDIRRALSSLALQTVPVQQILVIDQSSDLKTKNVVAEMKTKYAALEKSLIYNYFQERSAVKARNFGINLADSDIISFMDDDSELFPDYYENVIRYFNEDPGLGGVGGSVIYEKEPEGFKWELRKQLSRFFLLNRWNGSMTPSGFGYPIYERAVREMTPVQMLHGCNMNFRRSLIGSERFDEWFIGYSFREDAEFTYRLSKRAKILMVPDAKLYHHESPSNRLDVENLKRMEIRNYYYVFSKHKYRNFCSKFLFMWSLSGILFMDLLEFLSKRNRIKYRKLCACLGASWEVLAKK